MLFGRLGRRPGALALALTAYDIWRRLPPSQRRMILDATRTQGSRLARAAAERRRTKRPKP